MKCNERSLSLIFSHSESTVVMISGETCFHGRVLKVQVTAAKGLAIHIMAKCGGLVMSEKVGPTGRANFLILSFLYILSFARMRLEWMIIIWSFGDPHPSVFRPLPRLSVAALRSVQPPVLLYMACGSFLKQGRPQHSASFTPFARSTSIVHRWASPRGSPIYTIPC